MIGFIVKKDNWVKGKFKKKKVSYNNLIKVEVKRDKFFVVFLGYCWIIKY